MQTNFPTSHQQPHKFIHTCTQEILRSSLHSDSANSRPVAVFSSRGYCLRLLPVGVRCRPRLSSAESRYCSPSIVQCRFPWYLLCSQPSNGTKSDQNYIICPSNRLNSTFSLLLAAPNDAQSFATSPTVTFHASGYSQSRASVV